MAATNTMLGFWRRGPRTDAFISILLISSIIAVTHSFDFLAFPAFAAILATVILFCLPLLAFGLSKSFDNASVRDSSADITVKNPRYNTMAWIGSVLGVPIAISISKIVYAVEPDSILISKISMILIYFVFIFALFALYFSDSRNKNTSFVVKISLPIAIFSTSLYLGSDRQFFYLSNVVPDNILKLNVLIREWIFLISISVLILIGIFNNWNSFKAGHSNKSGILPKNQADEMMRAVYDAVLYGLEYLKHIITNIVNSFVNTWNWQNVVLSILAFFIMYTGIFFASNLQNFKFLVANIFDKNTTDIQNLFVLFLLTLWSLIFSICTVWVSDKNHNGGSEFARLDIYSSLNISMIAFLSVWVFSIIMHSLFTFGAVNAAGFSFAAVSPFFTIGSLVFLLGFVAVGLRFSQGIVVTAVMLGALLGGVAAYAIGAPGSIFPFDYPAQSVANPTSKPNGNSTKDVSSTASDGSWINGVWGIDGACDVPYEIRLSDVTLTVSVAGTPETLAVIAKSDYVLKTADASYRKSGDEIEVVASGLPVPQMLTKCAR